MHSKPNQTKFLKFEEIIISPKNKVGFADYLTSLNPSIKNNITEEYYFEVVLKQKNAAKKRHF